jgi:hypothetical protein
MSLMADGAISIDRRLPLAGAHPRPAARPARRTTNPTQIQPR